MMPNGYTVILVQGEDGGFSASVPAMPGCYSQGTTREDALANVAEAMALWTDEEAANGRTPLAETPGVVSSAVGEALEILDAMRQAGEVLAHAGYELELVTVRTRQSAVA